MSVEVFSILMRSIVSVSDSGIGFWFSCFMVDRQGCVQSVSVVVVIFMDFDLLVSTRIGFCVWFTTAIFPCEILTSCGSGH